MRKEAKIHRKMYFCFLQCLYSKGAVRVDAESISKVPSTAPGSEQTAALMPVTSPPGVVGGHPLCDN